MPNAEMSAPGSASPMVEGAAVAPESRLDGELRHLLAEVRVAALGTSTDSGEPFVSMVPFALVADGPGLVLHVSALAAHTHHLQARAAVSLLIMRPEIAGAPVHDLQRLTLQAQAKVLQPDGPDAADWQLCRSAYLSRFPEAAPMTALGDFRFVRLSPTQGRHIAGFGAARTLEPARLAPLLRPMGSSYEADAGLRRLQALLQTLSTPQPRRLISLLQLGSQRCQLVVGDGEQSALTFELPLGTLNLPERLWRHDPPRPSELEAAIAEVEDELMRWVPRLPVGTALHGGDPLLRRIAELAGGGSSSLSLDALERLFNRVCAVSEGRPASAEGLPDDQGFVAAVLILRELMHHLSFDALTLVS